MEIFSINSIAASSAKVASALATNQTHARAASGGGGSNSTADSSTITSSDFLTLLVSELKNQDPTQPTDPGAYIQQLVGVNSLQQLIQINQGLATLEPTSAAPVANDSTAVNSVS